MRSESALVVGGCGFIGYHILRALRSQRPGWHLHSLTRSAERNLIDGVQYHTGSILSYERVLELYRQVSPTIIIHAASPAVVGERSSGRGFYKVNVDGTKALLDCARVTGGIKAFVFTSSVVVTVSVAQHMATEDVPVKGPLSRCDDYSKSKAVAEALVLEHNGVRRMLTTSIRLPSSYGERDQQTTAEVIRGLHRGEHKVQIGNNRNLVDWVSGTNAAQAHVLAVFALLREFEHPQPRSKRVAGEAFFVTDGDPLPFWNHLHIIWKSAGASTSTDDAIKIPPWVAMLLAAVIETMYWVFTLGYKQPKALKRDLLKHTFLERTFCIDKARTRLGYNPLPDRLANVEAGVKWFLET